MRCAVIENGRVVNVADAEPEFAEEMGWVLCVDCRIGDEWDGESFIRQDPAPAISSPTPMDQLLGVLVEKKLLTEEEAKAIK